MSAIGIDLGTTNSCVAAVVHGRVETFRNGHGYHITPSIVAFPRGEELIGNAAKNFMNEEPCNTIYSVKRIIGRKFDDPKTQENKEKWPFKVVSSGSGIPQIKIKRHKEPLHIEEISGLVLKYMRQIACRKLDEDVRDAVVTVPAYFNHMQRSATKKAAELAGLNVLGIINEPTAAAIAFGFAKKCSENRNILVYDFGGGTFDVTVLSIKGSKFDVKASSGNAYLGGDDFTNRIVDHFVQHLMDELGKDITGNKRAKSKLWTECEKVKKELSYRSSYRVYMESIVDGVASSKNITRAKFQLLNKDLLDQTMDYVKDAIKESGMEKGDINFVVPVGGSSKIPYVIEMLQNYFGEGVVKDDEAPDEAIAKGAAIYAAFLKGETLEGISEIELSEVTPLSLGVRLLNKNTSVVIKRNTKIPVARNKMHFNSLDDQEVVSIPVCQGEEELFENNEFLGEFNLTITPKLKGEVKIDDEFSLDTDGILHVKATEVEAGHSKSIEIDLCGTQETLGVEKMKEKLESMMADDKAWQEKKLDLESTLELIKGRRKKHSRVAKRCDEILKWLEQDDLADVALEELTEKKEEILNYEMERALPLGHKLLLTFFQKIL